MTNKIHETVREHYAKASREVLEAPRNGGCSCGASAAESQRADPQQADPQQAESCCGEPSQFGSELYSALELG